jgi:hypothetical protein
MVRNWDDDLDDLEHAAAMFDKDPHTVYVSVWVVDNETDAEIVSEVLEEDNIVAIMVSASEAGEYAAFAHPDDIHVQVSKADSDLALGLLQAAEDLPGSGIVLDEAVLFEEDTEDDDSDDKPAVDDDDDDEPAVHEDEDDL